MKQTAVEWLDKELESYGDPQYCELEWKTLDVLIKQAKEMEEEQILAFANDYAENYIGFRSTAKNPAKDYYNRTNNNNI